MTFETGDKIKIFPDTPVISYKNLIMSYGFEAKVEEDYIVVGEFHKSYNTTNYGKQLKNARRAMKMTRAELAEKCGVTPLTVFDWEVGRRRPREWWKVQKILGI